MTPKTYKPIPAPWHDCARKDDFNDLYHKLDQGSARIGRIEQIVTRIETKLDNKEQLNGKRDQRVETIGEKAEAEDKKIDERVTNLEKAVIAISTKQDTHALYQKVMLGSILGLVVTIIFFFIEFNWKTFVLGI